MKNVTQNTFHSKPLSGPYTNTAKVKHCYVCVKQRLITAKLGGGDGLKCGEG